MVTKATFCGLTVPLNLFTIYYLSLPLLSLHVLVGLQIMADVVLFDPLLDVLSRQEHGCF
jgi:hypothetical protein